MIVVDASAITELLLQTALGTRVERRLYRKDEDFHAPHLLDVEVLSALRRLVHSGEVLPDRAEEAIQDLGLLRVVRHGHLDLALARGNCARTLRCTTRCTWPSPRRSIAL
jgi:predicted nucleic acid-binding protein